MKPQLYAHPFSSYCQKALIPLYANHVDFDYCYVGQDKPEVLDAFLGLWPIGKFPMMVHAGRTLAESSVIVEYVDRRFGGTVRFLPDDPDLALEVRMLDRIFDNYVMAPTTRLVLNAMRTPEQRDPMADDEARAALNKVYGWLDARMHEREFAVGGAFSLADCAAAPSLFYADWVHEIPEQYTGLRAYRARLLAYPPFARCVDEARPYRRYFPPGAPDRD